MTAEQIAIALLCATQAGTLCTLWDTHKAHEWFRKAWTRDTAELLFWKRHAVLRDPKSGKYVRKDRR